MSFIVLNPRQGKQGLCILVLSETFNKEQQLPLPASCCEAIALKLGCGWEVRVGDGVVVESLEV